MSWDAVIGEVKERLPKFNDYLLKGFREDQVRRFKDFIDQVFKEATLLFNGALVYKGYTVLSPEKRIDYSVSNPLIKGRVNIQQSELELVQYNFMYEDQIIPVYLYLPYLYEGALVVNDTRYYMQLAIIEKVIFRVADGVIIKVMRSPIQFWRYEQFTYTSTTGQSFCDVIITVRAHFRNEKSNKPVKAPLVLYLLAQDDFETVTTQSLGLPVGSVSFVSKEDKHDHQFLYFKVKEGIYLKVENESVMKDVSYRRFIASLLYILKMIRQYTIADVYDRAFYKILLGKALFGNNTKEALASGYAESHLDSLRTYLDLYTKKELALMRMYCDSIFDLFVAVFFNIDSWLLNYSPNDIFQKRIGGADLILMDLVRTIFIRCYDTLKKNRQLALKNIKSMLRMNTMLIAGLWNIQSLQASSSLYNDNDLISILIKKLRLMSTQKNSAKKSTNLIKAKEHQFHPSFLALESPLAISTSSPGISGDINPFAEIDRMGYFQQQKMPWYNEILPLQKYLVQV